MLGRLRGMLEARRLRRLHWNDYADHLRAQGRFAHIGTECTISQRANVTDPEHVWIGDRVLLSVCDIFGHDGSVAVYNRAMGTAYDAVGPVIIGDDVFIGHGAMIMPNTTIGSRVIIAAGSVVRGVVPDDSVYGGAPAKLIMSWQDYGARMERRNAELPWAGLLARRRHRDDLGDAGLEAEIVAARQQAWFGDRRGADPTPPTGS